MGGWGNKSTVMNPFKIPLFDNFFCDYPAMFIIQNATLSTYCRLFSITSYDYNYQNRVSSLWPFSQPLLPEKLNFSVVYFPKQTRMKEKIQKRIITGTGTPPELLRNPP